jgi:RNase P/RNase MRP subunit p29
MNKYQKEYIGKNITFETSKKTRKGIIIDETKNTFKINENKKIITILKNKKTFLIENEEINGEKITKKPEDRIKIRK